jgi:VanZ family protein
MAVMFTASTDLGSAEHTGSVLEPLLRFFVPDLAPATFELIHVAVRKTAHLTEYAILAVLLLRALQASAGRRLGAGGWRTVALAWLLTSAFAASDEFHQRFVESRGASPRDVLLDVVGATIGLAIVVAAARAHPLLRTGAKSRSVAR